MRAIQHTRLRAKNAKNDLNPIDLVKRNFCFETEGVYGNERGELASTLFCLISLGYHSELRVAIDFYQHYHFYPLSHIIFFSVHINYLCYLVGIDTLNQILW